MEFEKIIFRFYERSLSSSTSNICLKKSIFALFPFCIFSVIICLILIQYQGRNLEIDLVVEMSKVLNNFKLDDENMFEIYVVKFEEHTDYFSFF